MEALEKKYDKQKCDKEKKPKEKSRKYNWLPI
jgi:hypothetical protein